MDGCCRNPLGHHSSRAWRPCNRISKEHSVIPIESIEKDRLAIVGTSGSGKTYLAGLIAEILLASGRRIIIVDPLGAWYGLRLKPDGSPSDFNPVIFGGDNGDIAITENSGAIIGETVARSADSCIIDLSHWGVQAVQRRFMLAFLPALYSKTSGSPVHLLIDEADAFAPQVINDRDGDSARLLGMMETIVRRGHIKGFIPMLITQRPAVLNKNVMSQADGLIAMKLTASQDRKAIGAWVDGQADRAEWKAINAQLPTLNRGTGVVWLPSRGVLETMTFGQKMTFDSSRAPEYGKAKVVTNMGRRVVNAIHNSYPVALSFDAAARRVGLSKRSSAYRKYRDEVWQCVELVQRNDGKLTSQQIHIKDDRSVESGGVDTWASKLPPSIGKMLRAISDGYGDKQDIAIEAGISPTSSGLGSGLRELVELELIVLEDGLYKLTEGL